MNIIDYLNALEDMVLDGKQTFSRTKSTVNIEEMLTIIDEIKNKLPEEIKEANHARTAKNQLIIQAQKEVDDMMATIPGEVERRIEEHDITANAKEEKDRIIEDANSDADDIIAKAKEEAERIIKAAKSQNDEIKQGTLQYLVSEIETVSNKMIKATDELDSIRKELVDFYNKDTEEPQEEDEEQA